MIAIACRHDVTKRHGHDRKGNQRHRCILCGKTWTEYQPKPLGNMRIDKRMAILCLRLLMEGNSIRSVERITRIHRDTILNLLETIGRRAKRYWATKMQNLPAKDVECDEIWGYIRCKERTRNIKGYGEDVGDCYAYTAIERTSKLLLAWQVGRRTHGNTRLFAFKLRDAVDGRCQVSSDGFKPYETAIQDAFSGQVDFAPLIKTFTNSDHGGSNTRYSPPQMINIHLTQVEQ